MEELLSLPPEKILLKWMNFQLKKAGYKKVITNFSSDVKVGRCELEQKMVHLNSCSSRLFCIYESV